MKSLIAVPAFVAAAAAANSETFAFTDVPTLIASPSSVGNLRPSATETSSGAASSDKACSQVSTQVKQSSDSYPSIDAELVYACLKSVPIDQDAATITIKSLINLANLQSTIAYLKSPPSGYYNKAVDIIGGLNDIGKKVNGSSYTNEFDFENDIAVLLNKAYDGHFNFDGMAYSGVFRWRRNRNFTLVMGSTDGKSVPKIYRKSDVNGTASGSPSAVTKINGQDALDFLLEESDNNSYHDPDTRFNAMLWMQPAENYGYFGNPNFYPGQNTTLEFENGSSETLSNYAIVLDSSLWDDVEDGESFYDTFITPSSSSAEKMKRAFPRRSIPRSLDHWRDIGFIHNEGSEGDASVPTDYPEPAVAHTSSTVPLAGFFVDTDKAGTVGVLMIGTFDTEGSTDSQEFQDVVQQFIAEAKSRNAKIIIDVRANGGGKILLGYDTYLQFFPSQKPQLQSRYRATEATNILGTNVSSISDSFSNGNLYTSPFNYHSYLDADLKAFSDWKDMYGPTNFNNDQFTSLLRYNLSDPLTTSNPTYSLGITMTGYGDRSNFTEDPFKADDILIMSDGICASTCSLFLELMVQQSGVQTIAVGGRPQLGPMQPVGGTKGSQILQNDYLSSFATYAIDYFALSNSQSRQWATFMPGEFGIADVAASVNFQDNIRKGLEKDGIPTQFLNDTASCRRYYKASDYLNVTQLWSSIADVGFGKDGGLDSDACVAGSVTTKEAQTGEGQGSTTTGSSGSPSPSKSKAAAASMARPLDTWWSGMVVCGVVVLGSMMFGASLI